MLSKLILLGIICVLIAIYYDSLQIFYHTHFKTYFSKIPLISSEELKQYNGITKPLLYLSILGKVFNVTKGEKHYGPGNSYNFFIGRDATSAFVTGKMKEEEHGSDDILKFNYDEIMSLNHWVKFYNESYPFVGLHIGEFYDESGELTEYGKQVHDLLTANINLKKRKDKYKEKYPPCNIEWDADKGSRVWCTNKSGGIDRGWVGVPRKYYEPGSEDYRCACIQEQQLDKNKNIKAYENCETLSTSCFVVT